MTTARWQTLILTDGTADLSGASARGIALLHEYRTTGAIAGHWPCTAAELAALGSGDPADAGAAPPIQKTPADAPLVDILGGASRHEIKVHTHGFIALIDAMPRGGTARMVSTIRST